MGNRCVNCGRELNPGSPFCVHCGAAVGGGPQKPQLNIKQPAVLVIAILIVLVVVVVLIFALNGNSSGSSGNLNVNNQAQVSSGQNTTSNNAASANVTSPPVFTKIVTSSDLAPDDTTSYYGGDNVIDGVMETAWNEGSNGDGTGEWIEFSASSLQRVSSVSIEGGYPKTYKDGSDVYYKNNRPRQVTISYDGGSQKFMMEDLRGEFQKFTFDQPIETTFIRITIDSVYKGYKFDDCCIAEVKIS